MSQQQAAKLQAIAEQYIAWSRRHPDGSLGRIGNLSEASKYLSLAERARTWPDPLPGWDA